MEFQNVSVEKAKLIVDVAQRFNSMLSWGVDPTWQTFVGTTEWARFKKGKGLVEQLQAEEIWNHLFDQFKEENNSPNSA